VPSHSSTNEQSVQQQSDQKRKNQKSGEGPGKQENNEDPADSAEEMEPQSEKAVVPGDKTEPQSGKEQKRRKRKAPESDPESTEDCVLKPAKARGRPPREEPNEHTNDAKGLKQCQQKTNCNDKEELVNAVLADSEKRISEIRQQLSQERREHKEKEKDLLDRLRESDERIENQMVSGVSKGHLMQGEFPLADQIRHNFGELLRRRENITDKFPEEILDDVDRLMGTCISSCYTKAIEAFEKMKTSMRNCFPVFGGEDPRAPAQDKFDSVVNAALFFLRLNYKANLSQVGVPKYNLFICTPPLTVHLTLLNPGAGHQNRG